MNTRGLTELIVLNLALSLNVITQALFTALVLMALVTTLMAGPLLRLIDPNNEFGESAEAELDAAPAVSPAGVAPAADRSWSRRRAAPRSRSCSPSPSRSPTPTRRARWSSPSCVRPPRGADIRGGLQIEQRGWPRGAPGRSRP